jgi:acetyltransferase-like isoleucine patch superfamily enzyme
LRVFKYIFYPNVKIGSGVKMENDIKFHTLYGGNISIGKYCVLRKGVQLLTYGGNITIGENCSINPYTLIYGQGNTMIGKGVRIAAQCVIIPSNHKFSDKNEFIYKQGLTNIGITIEDDVWLGCGVKVLDGVTITKGCIIAAGSVVNKSTMPYSIYAGIPAKKIKDR